METTNGAQRKAKIRRKETIRRSFHSCKFVSIRALNALELQKP
jgi:hypothetical protein